jgi:hypothetical protein
MGVRKRQVVNQYRAVDLRLGDVILVRADDGLHWAKVTSVYVGYDGVKRLTDVSKVVREGYSAKTISNIGVALFIDYKVNGKDSLLDRMDAGLVVVVEVRRFLDRYNRENWISLDALSLVDVQEVGE